LANLSLMRVLRADFESALAMLSGVTDRSRFLIAAAFSLHPNDSLHPLIILDLNHRVDPERLLESVSKSAKVTSSVFRGSSIFTVEISGKGRMVVAASRNLVFFSRFSYLVEDALTQVTKRDQWWQQQTDLLDAPFCAVLHTETLAERCKGNMAPEWEYLPDWFASRVTSLVLSYDGKNWRAAAQMKKNNSEADPGEMPRSNIAAVLPDNTALLAWLGAGQQGALGDFASNDADDADFRYFVNPWVGKEAAWVLVEPYSPGMRDDQFWVCAVRDESMARKRLDEYGERSGLLRRYEYQTFEVRQFLSPSLLEPLLPEGRTDFQNPACVLLDGYAVFAASLSALELWIDKYVVSQTLAAQQDFLLLDKKLPVLANRFFYLNAEYAPLLAKQMFDPAPGESIQTDIPAFQHAGLFGVEMHNSRQGEEYSGMLVNQPDKASAHVARILWKTPLGGTAITQPFLVPGVAPEKEPTILIQDDQYDLYCLTISGNLLWRKKLGGQIMSAVQGIDFFNNGGVCYLFNTASALWVVDEEGREVVGYPLRLQSPATNGVTAADFDDERRYGLFIACENGNLYGYDQYGRPLTGWNPKSGVGRVKHPLIHFKSETRDYLSVLSLDGQLSVFNRIGVPQLAPIDFEGDFSANPPQFDAGSEAQRIVCMDAAGKVEICNLDGSTFHLGLNNGKNRHLLVFGEIIGDSRKDYAVMSGNTLTISGYEGHSFLKKAELTFSATQDTLFTTGLKGLIGTLNRSKRQIYLVSGTGKVFSGFPLAGTTPFVLYHVPADRKSNILIVGNGNGVYAYKVPG